MYIVRCETIIMTINSILEAVYCLVLGYLHANGPALDFRGQLRYSRFLQL